MMNSPMSHTHILPPPPPHPTIILHTPSLLSSPLPPPNDEGMATEEHIEQYLNDIF